MPCPACPLRVAVHVVDSSCLTAMRAQHRINHRTCKALKHLARQPVPLISSQPMFVVQTPQDQWEALKHLVAGNAPLAYNADGEAAAIVARLMAADVVLTTYQVQ